MKNRNTRSILTSLAVACLTFALTLGAPSSPCLAQSTGTISGKVVDTGTNTPLEGINVSIKGTTLGAASGKDGSFIIEKVPPGTYIVICSAVGYENVEIADVAVTVGMSATVDISLKEEIITAGDILVYGASKRPQRITQAPSAISTISAMELRQMAGTGQAARLFEATPGVDIAQNGVNDFNLNTRGFNSSLNRRVLVLMDNRPTSIAFLGAQEWNTISRPIEDLGRVELVRGPGSALYGANAFAGVINITTPAPKDILGTKVAVTGGQLTTFQADARHAGISGPWSYKLNFGRSQSKTWTKSRNIPQAELDKEYTGLKPELVALDNDELQSIYGSGRLDYDFANDAVFTAEAGMAQAQDQVFVTGLGRVQVDQVARPWARTSYTSNKFFAQIDYNGRTTQGGHQKSLNSGAVFKEDSYDLSFQFQHNFNMMAEKLKVVWGASHTQQRVDTDLTLTPDTYDENRSGLFGQVEFKLSDMLDFVAAGRVDRSTLHETQFSPKAAIVFSPNANHSFRATVNRAFQTPNYSEYFLRAPAGAPVNLAPLEAGIEAAIGGQDLPLNFGLTPVWALGNDKLGVETVTSFELGYKGVISKKMFITADTYFSKMNNFITDLLPRINPVYPAYQLPEGIPAALQPVILGAIQDALGGSFPLLSTLPDGSTALVVSYGNAGKVNEYGIELGMNYYLTDAILFNGNYTFFDFDVKEQAAGDELLPNTPKHKFNAGISYTGKQGLDLGMRVKYVDGFAWAAGVLKGDVPSYTLLNLSAGYKVTKNVRFGLIVNNLLDNEHFELFGGSVNGRRALATVTVER